MADLGFLPGVKRIMDRDPEGRPAAALLRHAGQRRRQARQALPEQPDHALGRQRRPPRRRDDPPRVPRRRRRQERRSSRSSPPASAARVLFTRTKHQAKKLAKQLTADGMPAVDLHGNLAQDARERNLEAFSSGRRARARAPPTSPPAASTSTTSSSSSTSTRRPSTRRTCTARAAPPAPAPRATSSPSPRPTRPARSARSPGRPASPPRCRRSSPAPGRSPRSPVRPRPTWSRLRSWSPSPRATAADGGAAAAAPVAAPPVRRLDRRSRGLRHRREVRWVRPRVRPRAHPRRAGRAGRFVVGGVLQRPFPPGALRLSAGH